MVFFHVVQYDFYKSFCIFEWCNLHSEFAKSLERKQTSFSGLRKSAEPLSASIKKPSMIEYFSFILKNKIDFSYDNFITKKISWTIKGYFKVLFLYILIVTIMTFFGINNSQKSIFNEPKVPELFKLIMIVFFMPLIEEIVFRLSLNPQKRNLILSVVFTNIFSFLFFKKHFENELFHKLFFLGLLLLTVYLTNNFYERIKTFLIKNKRYLIHFSVFTFCLIHIPNYKFGLGNTPFFLLFLMLLNGYYFTLVRLKFGFFYAVFIHIFHNTIVSIPMLIKIL